MKYIITAMLSILVGIAIGHYTVEPVQLPPIVATSTPSRNMSNLPTLEAVNIYHPGDVDYEIFDDIDPDGVSLEWATSTFNIGGRKCMYDAVDIYKLANGDVIEAINYCQRYAK